MGNAAIIERISQELREQFTCTYDCTRVWEAWFVGTMSEDDFRLLSDDEDRIQEIATGVLKAVITALMESDHG